MHALLRFAVLLVLGACFAVAAQAASLGLVTGDRGAAMEQASQALLDALRREGVAGEDILQLTAIEFAQAANDDIQTPRLWVVLGTDALQAVLGKHLRSPVLAALLPRSGFERVLREHGKRSGGGVSAIYLDQPVTRQLDLLHIALPNAKRIGVLWGNESRNQAPAWAAAAQGRGMELVAGMVSADNNIFAGLREAIDKVDVFVAVPDPGVFNTTTLPNILLAAYRARVPMLAFSPAYVKAGALMAVYSTPASMGSQVAGIARFVLRGGALPAPQYPLDFTVGVNDYVARSLGLTLDATTLTDQLRRSEKRP